MAKRKSKGDGATVGEMSPVYKVKVPRETMQRVEAARERMGLPYLKFFTRLLEFFAAQEDVIQSYMVDQIPPSRRTDFAELLLRQIASERGQRGESGGGAASTGVNRK